MEVINDNTCSWINDLNIRHFTPNELKVFYTIITRSAYNEAGSNISEIVENSGMSRSTVYKTIKKFEEANLIIVKQSHNDKREFNLVLASQ